MNAKERIDQWVKHYSLLQTDEAKCALFVQLKKNGEREALRLVIDKWVKE